MENWSETHIICPYCGWEHEENIDEADVFYAEGNHSYVCDECQREFNVDTEVSYYYMTGELEE